MKTKLFLSVFILCITYASAFALVAANLYGGYTVGGKYEDYDVKYKDKFRYGGSVHFNKSFLMFFQLGLGGYYQMSSVAYGNSWRNTFTVDKTDIGIDGYAALDIPLVPLSPYVRGGSATWNKIEYSGVSKTGNFDKHHVGGGLLITVLPIPALLKLQLFAEYIYAFGKEGGEKNTEHQVNLGIRGDFL